MNKKCPIYGTYNKQPILYWRQGCLLTVQPRRRICTQSNFSQTIRFKFASNILQKQQTQSTTMTTIITHRCIQFLICLLYVTALEPAVGLRRYSLTPGQQNMEKGQKVNEIAKPPQTVEGRNTQAKALYWVDQQEKRDQHKFQSKNFSRLLYEQLQLHSRSQNLRLLLQKTRVRVLQAGGGGGSGGETIPNNNTNTTTNGPNGNTNTTNNTTNTTTSNSTGGTTTNTTNSTGGTTDTTNSTGGTTTTPSDPAAGGGTGLFNTTNTTNSTSNTTNTTNTTINPSNKNPSPACQIPVTLHPYTDYSSSTTILVSNLQPQDLSLFQSLQVSPLPQWALLTTNSLSYLQLHINPADGSPQVTLPRLIGNCTYTFVVAQVSNPERVLTDGQAEMLGLVTKVLDVMLAPTLIAFYATNLLLSGWVMSRVMRFWNVTLLYVLLNVTTLPKFARDVIVGMLRQWFLRDGVVAFVRKVFQGEEQQETLQLGNRRLLEEEQFLQLFSSLSEEQKIEYQKEDDELWLGSLGLSSNVATNNFDAFSFISLYLLKSALIKLVLYLIPKFISSLLSLPMDKIFKQLAVQIVSFMPIILLSSIEVMFNQGQPQFSGLLNSGLQITVFFLACMYPLFVIVYQYKYANHPSAQCKQERFEQKEQLFWHVYTIFVCIFVDMRSKLGFFLAVTLVAICKTLFHLVYLQHQSWPDRLFKTVDQLIWVVYHMSFVYLFVVEQAKLQADGVMVGLVLLWCLALGGVFSVVELVVQVSWVLLELALRIRDKCCKKGLAEEKECKKVLVKASLGMDKNKGKSQEMLGDKENGRSQEMLTTTAATAKLRRDPVVATHEEQGWAEEIIIPVLKHSIRARTRNNVINSGNNAGFKENTTKIRAVRRPNYLMQHSGR